MVYGVPKGHEQLWWLRVAFFIHQSQKKDRRSFDADPLKAGLNIQKRQLGVKGNGAEFMGENYPRPRLNG
jgi:hypothetical protein